MKPTALVCVSHTGFTARYAALLSQATALPWYTLEEAEKLLPRGTPIVYLGWLMAGTVKDYPKADRRWNIQAVCGVGLGDAGAQEAQVRKGSRIPAGIPVFTLQGGIDYRKLQGVYGTIIRVLTRVMAAKRHRTAEEEKMLHLLQTGGDYVSCQQLTPVLSWYGRL